MPMKRILIFFLSFLFVMFVPKLQTVDLTELEKEATVLTNPSDLNKIAQQLLDANELSKAKKWADKALSYSVDQQNHLELASANELLGVIYQKRFDYANAMVHFLAAHSTWKSLSNEMGMAKANKKIGKIFLQQGDFFNAISHFTRSLDYYLKADKREEQANLYKYLGAVYYQQEFFGKAKESYTKAYDLYAAENENKKAAQIARSLGKISLDLGDREGALVYFSQSLDLHGALEDLPNIATDYNDLARTYFDQENLEEAKANNAIAYDIRSELQDTFGMAESLKNLGLVYASLEEEESATLYLKRAGDLLQGTKTTFESSAIYQSIATAFEQLENYPLAYKYEMIYAHSKEDLFNQDKALALYELTTRYQSESEAEEQRQQIALLEQEKISSTRTKWFLLAVIGLIAGMLGMLFYHFRKKEKDNRILKEKNEEINWQKTEIDRKNIQLQEKAASLDFLNVKLVEEIAERESIERSSFARDSFLAMMSHEMRTPINVIVGLSHLLLEENPRENQKESLRKLQFSANNLVVFINDVLDFSKIEAGKLVMQSREFRLLQVLVDVKKWSQLQAEDKDVQLEFKMESTVPDLLIGDPARLNQILTNLISSSLNYTDNGTISTYIKLHQLNDQNVTLEINIEDNGRGIEKARLEEMFRKFTRDSEDDIYEGMNQSGLELAITKRLVELQNGRIEARSTPGEGTAFKILLPYKIGTASTLPVQKEGKHILPYHYLVGKKILLIEDNKINQLVVRKILEKIGMLVSTANNGLEALDILRNSYFDLLLMDIQMPKMDGYRTTAEIRKSADPKIANVPIIALTASAYLTKKEKARLFGMDEHVGKPFGPEELLEKISTCLAKEERSIQV